LLPAEGAESPLAGSRAAWFLQVLRTAWKFRPIPVRRKFRPWICKVTPADCACQERNTTGCIPSNDGLGAGLRPEFPHCGKQRAVRMGGTSSKIPLLGRLPRVFQSSLRDEFLVYSCTQRWKRWAIFGGPYRTRHHGLGGLTSDESRRTRGGVDRAEGACGGRGRARPDGPYLGERSRAGLCRIQPRRVGR
jgi:hypothetical protein